MKAIVDEKLCVSCGLCADTCPAVFEMQNVAVVMVEEVPEDAVESCKEAVENCPVEAITLQD